jgi:hypothetical protein
LSTEDVTWTWDTTGDTPHYQVSGTFNCTICGLTKDVSDAATLINSVEATCLSKGYSTYQAKLVCDNVEFVYTHTDTINELAHDAEAHAETGDDSCDSNGTIAYWYCNNCKEYYKDEACTERIDKVAIYKTPKDHTLSATDAKWAWSDDLTKATATVTCSVCHKDIVYNATITSETGDGKITYTATATIGGATATDKKEEATAETKLSNAQQDAINQLKLYAAEHNLSLEDESVQNGIKAIENAKDDASIKEAYDSAQSDVSVASANAGDAAQVSNGGKTTNGEMIALIGIGVMIVAVGIVMIILVSRRKKNS